MSASRKRRKLVHASRTIVDNFEGFGAEAEEPCRLCDVCRLAHSTKECPVIKGNIRIEDAELPSKAILTLPDSLVCRELPDGNYEILAKQTLCQGTQFGPLDAPRTSIYNPNWKYVLTIFRKRTTNCYLDTSDPNKCNWMTLVRFAEESEQRNCICYQLDKGIYFTVVQEIRGGDPLVVSYSPGYQALVNGTKIQHYEPETLTTGLKEESMEEVHRLDHEHDYSSTPIIPIPAPPRRSERVRKVKVPDDDFVSYSIMPVEKAEPDEAECDIDIDEEPEPTDQIPLDDDTYEFKDDDSAVEEDSEEDTHRQSVTSPGALENKRKEKLKRLGAVLAQEEWECKFCGVVMEKIEVFSIHLINHYKKVGAARTEKSRLGKQSKNISDPAFVSIGTEECVEDLVEGEELVQTECEEKLIVTEETGEVALEDSSTQENMNVSNDTESDNLLYTSSGSGIGKSGEPKFPYVCDICVTKRVFNRAEYLIRHLKKHAGEYFCFECGQLHRSAEGFTSHECQDVGSGRKSPKKSECTICGKVFRSIRNLNHHLQMQHGKTYSCATCSRVFLTQDKVNSHYCRGRPEKFEPESLDTVDEVYLCGVCKESFPLLTHLEKHLRTHGCTIACSICTKALSHSKLKAHMAICETLQAYSAGETDELQCPTCAEVCEDIQDFREHMTKHTHPFMCPSCTLRLSTNADIKAHDCIQFQCDGCTECFDKFVDLKKHIVLVHPDVEYFCYECAIPFVTQEGFANHQTCEFDPTISVDTTKPSKKKTRRYQDGNFMCEKCGATYSKWSSLKTHRATHGPKRFICDTCGKCFHRREMLAEHVFVHKPPQFECADCGKKMKSKKSLEIHAQIHKGIKRFVCQDCGRAFTQKINLITHEMTHVPLDEKCFQCHYCSKKFSSKEYLGFHVQAHETGRNQVCDICKRSFVKPHMLMQHKRAAHGTQRYTCEFCNLVVKQKHSLRRHLEKRHAEQKDVWDIPGYLEARFVPGAGGFVHPEKTQKSDHAEEEENFEESSIVDEEVEEEQCVDDSVVESEELVGDISDSDLNRLPKLQVIMGENMVEIEAIDNLEGQEIYQPDEDGNIIITESPRVMILQMEEGGELVFALAHSQVDQILQAQEMSNN